MTCTCATWLGMADHDCPVHGDEPERPVHDDIDDSPEPPGWGEDR